MPGAPLRRGAYMAEKEGFEEKLVDLLRAGGTRGKAVQVEHIRMTLG